MKKYKTISTVLFFGVCLSWVGGSYGTCVTDLGDMKAQVENYGDIKTAGCYAEYIPSSATTEGTQCSVSECLPSPGLCHAQWTLGNWGDTLTCTN
jgi:hypothetical protein